MKNQIIPTPELLAEMDSLQIYGGLTPMSTNDKCTNENCDCPTPTKANCLVPTFTGCTTYGNLCFCGYQQYCGGGQCFCMQSDC